MKTLILTALAILGLAAQAQAGYTNFDKIAVGREADSNLLAVSPVTHVYSDIPFLRSIIGGDCTTLPVASVITTALFIAPATGLTQTAAVVIPAELEGTEISCLGFRVPENYLSGGVFEVATHLSGSITQGQLSMTADVFLNASSAGVTSLAKVAGTAIQVSPTCETIVRWISLTNAASYTPGAFATVKLGKAGTTRKIEILGVRFRYRPFGIANGQ